MKYIDSTDIETARQWLVLNDERCGYLVPLGENCVVLTEAGTPGVRNRRRMCISTPPYQKYIWHTHPLTSKSYPSAEDIIKVIKSRTIDSVLDSVIFTRWGLWEMSAASKGTISQSLFEELKENLKIQADGLWHLTQRGRGDLTTDTLPIIHSYINAVEYSLNDWKYRMSFTGWDALGGSDYSMLYT